MEFPDNLLEIISDDNHYEIYKFIHQTNVVDMSELNQYTIYNYISKLSNNVEFIDYINYTCSIQQIVDCFTDLSIYHSSDIIDIHIVSTFSEKTCIDVLTYNTNIIVDNVISLIITKLINSNSFIESLSKCSIDQYWFLQSYKSMNSIIVYLKQIYKFYYKLLTCQNLFKNTITLKNTIEYISLYYYKKSNNTFLSNLKNLINILVSRFNIDRSYYMREKQYKEEYIECQNQSGLEYIEEPFQLFKTQYINEKIYTISNINILQSNHPIDLQDLKHFAECINSYMISVEH